MKNQKKLVRTTVKYNCHNIRQIEKIPFVHDKKHKICLFNVKLKLLIWQMK